MDVVAKFERIIECTYELPVYREISHTRKACLMILRELPHMCYDMIDKLV